jgi:hypothetical protein
MMAQGIQCIVVDDGQGDRIYLCLESDIAWIPVLVPEAFQNIAARTAYFHRCFVQDLTTDTEL